MDRTEVVSSGQTVLQLTFDPGAFGQACVSARCQLDHPFYVKDKGDTSGPSHPSEAATEAVLLFLPGWSSFYPGLTVVHHGIPCYDLEVGALCLPPGHRDAKHADDSLVFDTFRR